ncbi:Metallo-dependent phosphatase-like protein [Thamnocephalis sphaerospora]|uniref:Metallo-dependent phosphatase-like protein n=1 Tax=Thamnocephalis sphaerospora TaxID=78915 RepID=A0A4P9XJX1_9FUNG|nr:Metallo-dependent phosphatase-like protein [Thamnocephalis sphaerospora]|eukprot:RKP06045.1 Metallo-dependent phosphatase-like protein [Thamnocephalis sphaerospora]
MLVGDDGGARPLDSAIFRVRCSQAVKINPLIKYAPKYENPDNKTFRRTSSLVQRRIVAVGDLHGDLESALSVLRMAHVIDSDGKWAGGSNTVLVQTGNVIDHGPDTKELLMLFPRLVQEANRAGGRVIQLLGESEVMNMGGDLRYVKERPDAFLSPESRATTFSSTGYLGSRLSNLPTVHRIGTTVFVHGGIQLKRANTNIQATNKLAKSELDAYVRQPTLTANYPMLLGNDGLLRYSSHSMHPGRLACDSLKRTLYAMGATRMVVGRVLQNDGKITPQCGGLLVAINTGISRYIRGKQAALEILPGGQLRALYPSGPIDFA